MGNDPNLSLALYIGAAMLTIMGIIAAGVVVVPIAVVATLVWGGVKLYQSHQLTALTRLKDAELRLAVQRPNPNPEPRAFSQSVFVKLTKGREQIPALLISGSLVGASEALYEVEQLKPTQLEPASNDAIDIGRWRDETKRLAERNRDPTLIEKTERAIVESFTRLTDALPPIALVSREEFQQSIDDDTESPSVPLMDVLPNPGRVIEDCVSAFYTSEAIAAKLFVNLRDQFDRNMHKLSGVPYTEQNKGSSKLIMPSEHTATAREMVDGYLHDTPLQDIFYSQIEFAIPEHIRSEHTHILGGSGHGKSTLLCQQFLSDVHKKDSPALIIIDGKGTFVKELQRFKLFEPDSALADRLVILNPQDTEFPPALNMLAPPQHGEHSEAVPQRHATPAGTETRVLAMTAGHPLRISPSTTLSC